jgi:D-glycero-D-manno-heptose 1,7-bisphosphate phosphatase
MNEGLAGSDIKRAVFVDRDGMLDRPVVRDGRAYPPSALESLKFLPGVTRGLHGLCVVEIPVIGATNQPDVARGTQRRGVVEAMNARLLARMPIIIILVCYEDGDDCLRRKPNPGALARSGRNLWDRPLCELS